MAESAHPEVDDIYHASRIYADESTILILASTSATSTDIVPTTTSTDNPGFHEPGTIYHENGSTYIEITDALQ
jgi:hypothetical protein